MKMRIITVITIVIIIIITARIRVYFEYLTDVQIFKDSPLMKTEIT
jgi:alpha-N-acetylglucosamine transferase